MYRNRYVTLTKYILMSTLAEMPPSKEKKRHEVHFLPNEVKDFIKMADAEGRSLKNWMETRLRELLPKKKKP